MRKPINKNETLAAQIEKNTKNITIEFYDLDTKEPFGLGGLRQRRGPCACLDLNCGCCAGMRMPAINFRRQCKFYSSLTSINRFIKEISILITFNSLYQLYIRSE